jgi:hypothetical protein
MIALALLLAALAPEDSLADQIVRCGLVREAIAADDAPFPHVTVAGEATDAQLDCVAAIWTRVPRVRFSDAAVQARFLPRYTDAAQRRAVAESRAWLANVQLLDGLPRFDPAHQSLAGFALALERLCGARPRSILRAHGHTLDIREVAPGRIPIRTIQCVMMSALASDLPAHGYVLSSGGVPVSWTEING